MSPRRLPRARRIARAFLAFAFALLLVPFRSPGADVTVQGSDTLLPLVQRWAEAFSTVRPGVSIEVNGGGTGTGVAALLNLTADVATCSRRLRAREVEGCVRAFGSRPREIPVALDAVVVHVHRSNSVPALDLAQLAGIYSGRIRNWREVGGPDAPIVAYGRENSSGTYEYFKETVLRRADFSGSVLMLQGTAQILTAVARDPNGIGYGTGSLPAETRRVPLSTGPGAKPVEPAEDEVRSSRYPLSRRLYLYVNPARETERLRAWLDWIRSPEGQRIAREAGCLPLGTGRDE